MTAPPAALRFALLSLIVLVGCSGSSLAPLEGTVTMDGQPLVGASVTFQRTEGPLEESFYSAETDASGHYVAASDDGGKPGVVPGKYRVFITTVEVPSGADDTAVAPPDPVPVQFRDGSTTVTVTEDGATSQDFSFASGGRRRR